MGPYRVNTHHGALLGDVVMKALEGARTMEMANISRTLDPRAGGYFGIISHDGRSLRQDITIAAANLVAETTIAVAGHVHRVHCMRRCARCDADGGQICIACKCRAAHKQKH